MSRRVLVLGATSAIARAAARRLAAEGDRLFLVARNGERLETVARDLEIRGARTVGRRQADLDALESHAEIVAEALRTLDGLDAVLLAHGILGEAQEAHRDYRAAHRVLQTNLLSAVSLLTLVAEHFESQGSGTIVAVSSVAGDRGRQSNYVYGSSKGGLSIFLQGLRNRLHARGVRVVTIKPGFVDTPMTAHLPKGPLFATPDAIARGIVRAIRRGGDVVYLPWIWWPIMTVIRLIPETIFKRLKL